MQTDSLEQVANNICQFIQTTFSNQQRDRAVIALSGGIDSAVSLRLLTRALGTAAITPVLLPYGEQTMSDAEKLSQFNNISEADWVTINIKPIVDQICTVRKIATTDHIRRGNIMARVRMILVFDLAKEQSALVCGTENKSEHYLGYFTRFGDAASDLEPISQLYKTQVRALAHYLHLPTEIITKAPSAGLWEQQTDEQELGFSYEQADQVLEKLIDERLLPADITIAGIATEVIQAVCARVQQQAFKRAVPYTME